MRVGVEARSVSFANLSSSGSNIGGGTGDGMYGAPVGTVISRSIVCLTGDGWGVVRWGGWVIRIARRHCICSSDNIDDYGAEISTSSLTNIGFSTEVDALIARGSASGALDESNITGGHWAVGAVRIASGSVGA